jgi:arylsulfatase A-like enzyme
MATLRAPLAFLLVLAGLTGLDLLFASMRLAHPVPDPGWPAALAAARWGLLALVPALTAGIVWARRGRPALGAAIAGVAWAAAAAMASSRWRGALPPVDEAAVALEVLPVLVAGALGAGLGGRAPRAAPALGLAVWLALAAPWGSADGRGAGAPDADAPDVVLLTLDTFREDALSASPRAVVPGLTPALDAAAAAGCRVDGALAPAPLTGPSHGALLTGRTPAELGLLINGGVVDPAAPRLAERFAAAGYDTGAFVSSAMVAGALGYAQGFAVFDDDLGGTGLWEASTTARLRLPMSKRAARKARFERAGTQTVGRMAEWLGGRGDAPVFVWLHLYDTHTPYEGSPEGEAAVSQIDLRAHLPDPEAFAEHPAGVGLSAQARMLRRMQRGPRGKRARRMRFPGLPGMGDPTAPPRAVDGDKAWRHAAAYYAGAARTDAIVAQALSALEATRGRPPVLVVVGDHGESLTGHNEISSHQQHLYRQNLAVPLLLPAGGPCPMGPVSTMGVGHALLTNAGLDATGYPSFEEAPMAAWLRGQAHAPDDETRRVEKAAITVGRHRAIGERDGAWVEVYDLEADPHEQDPTAEPPAGLLGALDAALSALRESEEVEVDAETRAALEALGYMGE